MKRAVFVFGIILIALVACQRDVPISEENDQSNLLLSPTAQATSTAPIQPTEASPTKTPTEIEQEIGNLVAFTQVYALVRYFHPSDQVAAIDDWDNVVMSGLASVRGVPSDVELAQSLNAFFTPLAPNLRVTVDGNEDDVALFDETTPSEQIIFWEHDGVGADRPSDSTYKSERIVLSAENLPSEFHDPVRPYSQPIGDGLTVSLPLVLYLVDDQTYPMIPLLEEDQFDGEYSEELEYLASITMYWSVTQHFYPYFDVVDVDWDVSLAEAFKAVLLGNNEDDWEIALKRLVAGLDDGHASVTNMNVGSSFAFSPFVSLNWVEDQLVITGAYGAAENLVDVGDVVVKIGEDLAIERLENEMSLVSASTIADRRFTAISQLLLGAQITDVVLTVRKTDGSEEVVELTRNVRGAEIPTTYRPLNFAEVAPSIFYINLSSVNRDVLESELLALEGADGLIFDLRGYPNGIPATFLELLITDTITTPQFLIPQTILPNQEAVAFESRGWSLEPRRPLPLSENIIFITNHQAISYSETLLTMVSDYEIGEIVGELTAGTNGNINEIKLPSGHLAVWTGLLVLNRDGSQYHGVGVQPTIPVSQTMSDLRQGIDTQLQAAIQVIEERVNEN